MKSQMRVSFDHWNWLLTKTKENRLWKFDKPWIKRLKDVVLFGKNSFQMRENEKAWWKAIALLREIELEKLISVLTRCTWCADDCVRGCEVTYLYISGKITIPKQSECNVNSYDNDIVPFCMLVSWLEKRGKITRLGHINLHKCWLLAGFLVENMILWLQPIWVSRTWLSTND